MRDVGFVVNDIFSEKKYRNSTGVNLNPCVMSNLYFIIQKVIKLSLFHNYSYYRKQTFRKIHDRY